MRILGIEAGSHHIVFRGPGSKDIKITLSGDCCSKSYFDADSLKDIAGLVGEYLVSVEDRFIREEQGGTQEYSKISALVLTTDKQSVSVMWRNDSNGYYSGSVEVTRDQTLGGRMDL